MGLTPTQQHILSLHDQGYSTSAIAEDLGLTDSQIEQQLKRISLKARTGRITLPLLPLELVALSEAN